MAADKRDLLFCDKCHRTLKRGEFYQSNNLEKYPNAGAMNTCKKCLTMQVDNWDPSTYLWILQEIDVPYIPEEWDNLLASYGKDPSKVTGMTILGRYLSKMKLKQYKDYRWKDTQFIQNLKEKRLRESMEAQGKDIQEITSVIEESRAFMHAGEGETFQAPPPPPEPVNVDPGTTTISFNPEPVESAQDLGLTEEDVLYLRLRWGASYKPSEWIWLERFYRNFENTYDIQTAGHKDTLMKLAKVSLKLDQLIDLADIDGAQKTEKMYNSLMKSGNFTALQNKQETQQGIDSIGEVVAICETKGFIPRYYIDSPKDKVDRVLQDLQDYTRSLIMEETNIGELIENAVKQIESDKQREEEAEAQSSEEEAFEEALFSEDKTYLTDNDFHEFTLFEDELAEKDQENLQEEVNE